MPEKIKSLKIVRRCPRCHAHLYHFATLYQAARPVGKPVNLVEIRCAHCSHQWQGRYLRDEWN